MNILVLTTLYHDIEDTADSTSSPVVQNFAKEWVKDGHSVLLIHNFNTFLLPFYFIPKGILENVFNRVGFRTTLNLKQRHQYNYNNDGVNVYRLPILKVIPRGRYNSIQLKRQLTKIVRILNNNSFLPDIIVAHAENPQVYQLYKLKQTFPKAKTCLVLHGVKYLGRPKYKKWKDVYFESIDAFGFRSERVLREAQEKIGFNKRYFMCPSGVSDKYTAHKNMKINSKVKRIIYVGTLIERKHLKTLIEALSRYPEREYELVVIGIGAQRDEDENLAKELSVNATFLGKLPHEEVINEMEKSDCFIMVSENEVFGLVYLEAMARGCITVASENEGMEGVIESGINGFLCRAGDVNSLSYILDRIESLNIDEQNNIRNNAFELARKYSESNVARSYLNNILDGKE